MKVAFNGESKLIIVNSGANSLDIQIDLYSDWKEWIQESDNSKFLAALRTVGGDPTIRTKQVAPYFFLMNGWKIRPYEGDHTLTLIGNLFVDDSGTYGSNIVVPTLGNYTVLVNMMTTSDAISLISGSGVTEQDKIDIKDLVVGSDEIQLIKKLEANGCEIKDNQLIIYDDNGVTPFRTFNLSGILRQNYAKRVQV